MELDWDDLLLAYLHDPPDKALAIVGHVSRASRYAASVRGLEPGDATTGGLSDQLASVIERLPMPTAGERGERAVGPEDGQLTVFHPLSGDPSTLTVGEVNERAVGDLLAEIARELNSSRERFLAVWRLLPERLAQLGRFFLRLPADTRIPDHTTWHHLDTTAGLRAALSGPHGPALLSFSLGPVQDFIASARSVRDLWSGSMILSWVTFQAMLPVVERLGPTAIVYPSLRGLPWLDLWLRSQSGLTNKLPLPDESLRSTPCLPNRFLAVVPWGTQGDSARQLAESCRNAGKTAWLGLATQVRRALDPLMSRIHTEWAKRWDDHVGGFLEIRTATLPLRQAGEQALASLWGKATFAEAFPEAQKVRGLADAIPEDECPHYLRRSNPERTNLTGLWQAQVELAARLMEACRGVRHLPPSTPTAEVVPPKCSLMGSYEQVGPDGLDDSRKFWEEVERRIRASPVQGIRLRPGERFCAVALVKRFAESVFFARELGLSEKLRRVPDTATIAARKWLADAAQRGFSLDLESLKSGQWLHWPKRDFDRDEEPVPDVVWKEIQRARESELGKPPAYYGVLAMDGDDMGGWLRGERSPHVRNVMHPRLREYFGRIPETENGLDASRPVGPALHAAISEALTNFAMYVAPSIVEKHLGLLIYSGGDDLLALLPATTALACAHELRLAFSGDPAVNSGADHGYYRWNGRDLVMMGSKATASAGLAIVHYREDLRFALNKARDAEAEAKSDGRNLLRVVTCRRSGEHAGAACPWHYVGQVLEWTETFLRGASDRWAYHLREESSTLEGLEPEAVIAEIRRQLGRTEGGHFRPEKVAEAFSVYLQMRLATQGTQIGAHREVTIRNRSELRSLFANALHDFIVLCQTASFLARGREE